MTPTTSRSHSTPRPGLSRARQLGHYCSISPPPLRAVSAAKPSFSPTTAVPPRRRSRSPSKRACFFFTSTATIACW
ncbi:hypothetical protein CSPAE12_00739 [Colletotrichum incanum]|nr:hypothetical protein CSPAE12_00739 [Colletotrichum incanum]